MHIRKSLLAGTAAFGLATGMAWADGGPVPEPEPPLPPAEPVIEEPEPEPEPAPSHNNAVMVLELGAGGSYINPGAGAATELGDDFYPIVEGAGRANIPLSTHGALQIDVEGLAGFGEDGGTGIPGTAPRLGSPASLQTVFSGAGHLSMRGEKGAFGILGQVGSSNGGAEENANFYNVGGELLFNMTNTTLIGQGGFFWADDEDNFNVMTNAWWVRPVLRFYTGSGNTRFQLDGAYSRGEENTPGFRPTIAAFSWGARIDSSFSGKPVGWFLAYSGNVIESDAVPGHPFNEIEEHNLIVGARVHFGNAATIKEADRTGPQFDTPDIGRWTGWTLEVVD